MEKEALLSVIVNNLRELEMMVESFKGKDAIIPAFMKLTLTKLDNVRQEVELLDQLYSAAPTVSVVTPSATVVKTESTIQQEAQVVIEKPVAIEPISTPIEEPKVVSVINPSHKEDVLLIEKEISIPVVEEKVIPVVEKSVVVEEKKDVKIEESVMEPISVSDPKSEQHQELASKARPSTLGDMLGSEKTSLIDKISSGRENAGSSTQGMPVDDIKKAIGINDRFLFVRELFSGNSALMEQTINQLNSMKSYDEANQFLTVNFSWQGSDATVQSFMSVVKRRFI